MKVLIIDPTALAHLVAQNGVDFFDKLVTEVEYTGDITQIYTELSYPDILVQGKTFVAHTVDNFDTVYLDDADCIYVDGEGFLTNPDFFFYIRGGHSAYAGKGVVLSTNDEGESISPKSVTREWLLDNLVFAFANIEYSFKNGVIANRRSTVLQWIDRGWIQ